MLLIILYSVASYARLLRLFLGLQKPDAGRTAYLPSLGHLELHEPGEGLMGRCPEGARFTHVPPRAEMYNRGARNSVIGIHLAEP